MVNTIRGDGDALQSRGVRPQDRERRVEPRDRMDAHRAVSRRGQEESAGSTMTVARSSGVGGDAAAEEGAASSRIDRTAAASAGERGVAATAGRFLERVGEGPRQRVGVAVGVDRLERQAAALIEQRDVAREAGRRALERRSASSSPAISATLALGPNAISFGAARRRRSASASAPP